MAAVCAIAVGVFAGLAGAGPLPDTCHFLTASPRDPYLHFTAWEDRGGVIRGRLKNTHSFETARATAIRFTFSLNPAGGGYQGSYCLVLGDILPGAEAPFAFVRPRAVQAVPHVKQDPHALW